MIEVFKNIVDFPGYQISNTGKVRSNKKGRVKLLSSKRSSYTEKYPKVTLYKDGIGHTVNVHVLVAQAFVPNDDPNNKTIVNHIDEDKSNNVYTNLEWCTYSHNNNHGTRNKKAGRGISESFALSDRANKIFAYKDGTYIFFSSATQCGKYFGRTSQLVRHIAMRNSGVDIKYVRATSVSGYLLYMSSYIDDADFSIVPIEPITMKKGRIVAIKGSLRFVFNSIVDAEKSSKVNLKHTAIGSSLKTGKKAKGWNFYYLEDDK